MSYQTEEVGMVEGIDEGEGMDEGEGTVDEDTVIEGFDGTFHFNRCQNLTVYIKCGNASGNKVEGCGNMVSQVTRMSCFLFSCEFGAH